ncbi:membrane-bound lytic murein transglycosylase MltF [Marinicella litoralis]|uniref:membrane-bound lytic murein transglycosylase MltF n=1 Tax=Marinicella litoralis TaxID=644220 RepID=UPI0013C2A408|nr:membrane-bound lytic murein transglycosylase MltF [Marinicella litoralis]
MKSLGVWLLLLVSFLFIHSPLQTPTHWQLIQHKNILTYGTRTSLLSYFEVGDDIVGYEYKMLKEFCKQHNIELNTIVFKNNGQLLNALHNGAIDVAGGHLSITQERAKSFTFTEPISQTAINLVTHYDYRRLNSINQFQPLVGQLIANSSYEEMSKNLEDFKPSNISSTAKDSMFELFRKINKKEIDYTFADSEIIDIYQHFIPGIYQPIQLSEQEDIAFLLPKNRSEDLIDHLNKFIQSAKATGKVTKYKNELLTHLPQIDIADTVTFFDKLQTEWPKISELVMEVAYELEFDPSLLSAISYQESHWDPDAVSISGVKGLMMLTESTAEEMDVLDRTDPRESLIGGVKYIRMMQAKFPDRISSTNRLLFALAAYNVGFGHVEDARILAQRAGKNPDIWLDVEPYLEKLNNPAIAHELKYGIADGKTAVIYVNNIMTYKQLMTWKIQKERLFHYKPNIL